jgi:hypothetical protein
MVKTKGGENRSKEKRAKVLTKAASRGSRRAAAEPI